LAHYNTFNFSVSAIFIISVLSLVHAMPTSAQALDTKDSKASQQYASAKEDPPTGDSVSSAPNAPAGVQPPSGYHIGPADELMITVWHEPELSEGIVVRPDGMITLPLLNDIKVAGLTTEETQSLLTEKLKTLVNDPQVTVIVKAVHSQKVFAAGNVVKQGVYALDGRKTVLELLVEAGGLGPFAKGGSIYILRNVDGKETRIYFNYKKALSGKSANPELQPGDMVVVP